MEEQTKELKDYIDAFRRRRMPIMIVTAAFFVLGLAAALFWPPTYRSTATILIEEQEVPPELIRSTITSYATQRIQTISQTVMTRANLMQIIEKYHIPPLSPDSAKVNIQGTLRIVLDHTAILNDSSKAETTTYTLKLRDRANHWSNEVVSKTITVNP